MLLLVVYCECLVGNSKLLQPIYFQLIELGVNSGKGVFVANLLVRQYVLSNSLFYVDIGNTK